MSDDDDARRLTREPPVMPLTPPVMFVCTYVASLGGLHCGFEKLAQIMCGSLRLPIVAVNSNFGCASMPGFEDLVKKPKVRITPPGCRWGCRRGRRTAGRCRHRLGRGDGGCGVCESEPVRVRTRKAAVVVVVIEHDRAIVASYSCGL